MDRRDDPAQAVRWLLDDLCGRLGFCLSPAAIRELQHAPPADVDGFIDAVVRAEGLSLPIDEGLRRQLHIVVTRHMSRRPRPGGDGPRP